LSGASYEADFPPAPGALGSEITGPAGQTALELELIKKAQAGDRDAYGRLVLAYQDRLYNAIVRMVGDREEARELAQEAFTRGLAKIDGFRGDASPYTWLFRIATNLCISRLRKIQRRRTFSLEGAAGSGHDGDEQTSSLLDRVKPDPALRPDEELERRERNQHVVEALGRLDPEYRAVLVMRDVEGFDYQQMADVLGLPLGTLKSRLFRARLALRDELKPYMNRQ
jgi:RNA polymerase sigma-70 factor (ECF subfamily)